MTKQKPMPSMELPYPLKDEEGSRWTEFEIKHPEPGKPIIMAEIKEGYINLASILPGMKVNEKGEYVASFGLSNPRAGVSIAVQMDWTHWMYVPGVA